MPTVSPLHHLWPPWLGSLGYSGQQSLIREGKVAEMAPDKIGVMLTGWGKHPGDAFGVIFSSAFC